MPRIKTTNPIPSKHKGQRSQTDPLFLVRYLPNWTHPNWLEANSWRRIVESQQVCGLCQEALISSLLSLDWKIEPRDSTQRDELKDEIKYYTKFFEYTGDYEYSELLEWLGGDYLTLPFGGAVEVGRQGDSPDGKLLWLELLDGGTLFPTLNVDYPYGQSVNGASEQVFFPKHALNRIYMSPRREITRKGWGVAPPEKIYFALQLLTRGDYYYAALLLDTPESGILDLKDMSKDSAEQWVMSWREMMAGIDPYKVPVLYEHTEPANFIPFTRSPVDITYNETVQRYTALLCSGYGVSPSDIGLGGSQNGGNTLAGSIRDDRQFKRRGFARFKKKMSAFFDRMLPDTLRFKFIDIDDETAASIGRARLAVATASQAYVNGNMFTQEEMRNQAIADGLITISVPESLPPELKKIVDQKQEMAANSPLFGANGKTPERPSMLGRPVAPSSGGWGEAAAKGDVFRSKIFEVLDDEKRIRRLLYLAHPAVSLDVKGAITALEGRHSSLASWVDTYDEALWSGVGGKDLPELTSLVLNQIIPELANEAREMVGSVRVDPIIQDVIEVATNLQKDLFERDRVRSFVIDKREVSDHFIDFGSDIEFLGQLSERLLSVSESIADVLAKCAVVTVRNILLEDIDNDMEYVVFGDRSLQEFRRLACDALGITANDFAECVSGIIINSIRREKDASEGLEKVTDSSD